MPSRAGLLLPGEDFDVGPVRDLLDRPYAATVLGGAAQFWVVRLAMIAATLRSLNLVHISGTSAGAIAGLLGAIGLSDKELREVAVNSPAVVRRLAREGPVWRNLGTIGAGFVDLSAIRDELAIYLDRFGISDWDDLLRDPSTPIPMGTDPGLWKHKIGIGLHMQVFDLDDEDADQFDGRIDDPADRARLIRKYFGKRIGIPLQTEAPDEIKITAPDLAKHEDFQSILMVAALSATLAFIGEMACYAIQSSENPAKKKLYIVMDGSTLGDDPNRLDNGFQPNIPLVVNRLPQLDHNQKEFDRLIGGFDNPYGISAAYLRTDVEQLVIDEATKRTIGKLPFSTLMRDDAKDIWAAIFDHVYKTMVPVYQRMFETLPEVWSQRLAELDERKAMTDLKYGWDLDPSRPIVRRIRMGKMRAAVFIPPGSRKKLSEIGECYGALEYPGAFVADLGRGPVLVIPRSWRHSLAPPLDILERPTVPSVSAVTAAAASLFGRVGVSSGSER